MAWKTEIDEGVATLTLDHPPLNILTRAVLAELVELLDRLGNDPAVRAVRLVAAGRHFSAGADVGEHLPPQHERLIPEFAAAIERLAAFPLPVIAAVRGRCLGGGFELVQAADLIVAAEGATFGQPEILLGVTAPAACVLLPRRAGWGFAAEVLFTGDAVSAARAHAAGVVHALAPDDRVEEVALALARRCSRHSAVALRETKRAMREGSAQPVGEALRRTAAAYVNDLMRSEDAVEGLTAFVEKRPAVWRHR